MFNFLHKKGVVIGGSILLGIVAVLGIFFLSSQKEILSTTKVKAGSLTEEVTTSGKVVSTKELSISFERSGKIVQANLNVGDHVRQGQTIVALDSSDLQAQRQEAEANLEIAQAGLSKLGSDASGSTILIAKSQVINSITTAYTQSDDAIHNKVDQYFLNPKSVYPQIKYYFDNYYETKDIINNKRLTVENTLTSWSIEIKNLSTNTYTDKVLTDSQNNLNIIKDFLDTLSPAVNSLQTEQDLPQTTIDKYKNDLLLARSNINSAIAGLVSANEKFSGSVSDIPVNEAKIKLAEATVAGIDSQLSKTVITSPIDGVISKQDAKVGEVASPNTPIVGIISDSQFEIDTNVSETDIGKIKIGNKADVTLDTYGTGQIFAASVSQIDPAQTLVGHLGLRQ